MKKIRGFKLGRKLVKVFKPIIRFRPRRTNYSNSFLTPPTPSYNPISRICSFTRFVRRRVKGIYHSNSDTNYVKLGEKGVTTVRVPKGHLALYIGESEDDTKRVVLPVIYFNHPLFGELLKEAERVYGFSQSGKITLPCGISEFEKVKMRIADWDHCRRRR
ncbi:SMALL AUXIN UPREGULATED RNA 35 [Hibiscus trionum]|uniref:SMALL AUXIN UPREGULATED RNA 35 n=1 Tax=Hibiscus trionum TaxID=183268 RepID=A0A9W7MBQ1_HIBTR|nr:SMALL AUXIN UPREGULATED RNA 35 [Hibiscus trionum]